MTPNEIIERMGWALLREQKTYCLNEARNNPDAAHIYDGIVHLMDALQDAAYEYRFATEEEIYGNE